MELAPFLCIATLSMIFWTLLYACIQWMKGTGKDEWSSRVVAGAHAVLMIVCCGYLMQTGHPFSDPGGESTRGQEITITISLGYFVYDLGWCLYYQPEGKIMLVHHTLAILCFTTTLLMGVSGGEGTEALFFLEFSNPLLQARWFIRSAGYKSTSMLFIVADLLFIFTFCMIRIVGGTYVAFLYVKHPKPQLMMKGLAIMLYMLSWGFGIYMGQYFYAKYVRHRRAPHDIQPSPAANSQDLVDKTD